MCVYTCYTHTEMYQSWAHYNCKHMRARYKVVKLVSSPFSTTISGRMADGELHQLQFILFTKTALSPHVFQRASFPMGLSWLCIVLLLRGSALVFKASVLLSTCTV